MPKRKGGRVSSPVQSNKRARGVHALDADQRIDEFAQLVRATGARDAGVHLEPGAPGGLEARHVVAAQPAHDGHQVGRHLAADRRFDELAEAEVREAPGVGRQQHVHAERVGVDVGAAAGRIGADRHQGVGLRAWAQQDVLDEVQAFAAVVFDEVGDQLADHCVHHGRVVEVLDAPRQHGAFGVDDVEVVAAVGGHGALVGLGLLAGLDREDHLGARRLGRRVACARRQQDGIRDRVAHAEAELVDAVGHLVDLVVGVVADQAQVAPREVGDAQQAGDAPLQPADIGGVPDTVGGVALHEGAGAVMRQAGHVGQEARLVADQAVALGAEGRGHGAAVVGEVLRDAGQQVVEQALLARRRLGVRFDRVDQLARRDAGRVELRRGGDAVDHLAGQHMAVIADGAEALGDRRQIGRVHRQPVARLRQQGELVGHQLVEEQQPALQLQRLRAAPVVGALAQALVADAVDGREVELERGPVGQCAGAPGLGQRHVGAVRGLDPQPRGLAQFGQARRHRRRHLRQVETHHRQPALAEHQPALGQRQARQPTGPHRHAPGVGDFDRVADHRGRVGVGGILVVFVGPLDRVDPRGAQRPHAGDVHRRADDVGQADLGGQRAAQQIGLIDEAVPRAGPVEDVGQRQSARQHRVEVVAGQRRRQHLADRDQQLRSGLHRIGAGVEVDLGAQREVLRTHGSHLDEVFAQVARGLEHRTHFGQHRVARSGRADAVHEFDLHAQQAAQQHRREGRMGRRRGAQLAPAQVGVQHHVGDRLQPGVLDAGQVDDLAAAVHRRQRAVGQHGLGRMELGRAARRVVRLGGDQVLERQAVAVGQVGQRVAGQLQHRDAGVVRVVVGPGGVRQAPHLDQTLVEQRAQLQRRVVGRRAADRRQRLSHRSAPRCGARRPRRGSRRACRAPVRRRRRCRLPGAAGSR